MEIIYIVAGVIVIVLAYMVYHINNNYKASTKCTDALGNEFVAKCKTTPCECPTGYSSADWLHTTSCENKTLTMPYTNSDGKKLQLINPMYGFYTEDNVSCSNSKPFRTECTSINNAKLQNDVLNGNGVNLQANQYSIYFGYPDPCDSTQKYVSFDYRYV